MIGILDLNLGNLKSVANAVYELGYDYKIIKSQDGFDDISHLIIPGVGAYPMAMKTFNNLGLKDTLTEYVCSGKPLLGICLGMQILSLNGEEIEPTEGLGLVEGRVKPFSDINLRVPHVGWNSLVLKINHPIFENIKSDVDFYFVHSYHFECANSNNIYAVTNYGYDFPSVVGYKNVIGVQFHPEKSQNNGLRILENFCEWDGQ